MNVTDYLSETEWKKLVQFSEKLETPCVVINLEKIKKNYLELKLCCKGKSARSNPQTVD